MTIQMGLSAASVSVLSTNETQINLAKTESETYTLNSDTMKASLTANETMANADAQSIIDQANAQKAQAIGQMVGAATGLATIGVGAYKTSSDVSEASTLEEQAANITKTGNMKTTLVQVDPAGSPLAPASGAKAGTPTVPDTAAGEVEVNETNPAPAKTSAATRNQEENQLTDEQKEQVKTLNSRAENLRSTASNRLQTTNTVSGMIEGMATSLANIAGTTYTNDQATQTKIKDLETGITQTLNSLTGLLASQLGNLDQARQSLYQTQNSMGVHVGG